MGPVAAVIGAVATVGGTVMQYSAQKKAIRRHRGNRTYLPKEATDRPSERLNYREHKLSLLEPLGCSWRLCSCWWSRLPRGTAWLWSRLL